MAKSALFSGNTIQISKLIPIFAFFTVFIRFFNLELYYKEFGQGKPVIILHGMFGFSDNWQTIAKALADHHLIVTPDLRNHGRSPHTDSHTYAEMAEDLRAFMESRWMFSAAVIGHSMGGKAAMQLALSHPEMVERLVVIDMDPGQATDNHKEVFSALNHIDFSKIENRQQAEDVLSNKIEDPGTRQFLLKNITRNADGRLAWKMNLPVIWNHYSDILAPVNGEPYRKPALFVRGGKSNYVKDSDLPLIKTLFPLAELVTIEGAGHWVHADKPAELLKVLKNFLND